MTSNNNNSWTTTSFRNVSLLDTKWLRFTILIILLFVQIIPVFSWVSVTTTTTTNLKKLRNNNDNNRNTVLLKSTMVDIEKEKKGDTTSRSSSNDDDNKQSNDYTVLFTDFVDFLKMSQNEIIHSVEKMDESEIQFTNDTWGIFDDDATNTNNNSGGITRVFQGGNVIEKGACSFTLIQDAILSEERANAIRSRQNDEDKDNFVVKSGDKYSAAALSIVFHSRSPMVPTFRSDVRVFFVEQQQQTSSSNTTTTISKESKTMAWFGGGADLTPYYLFDEDITFFHNTYRDLCRKHSSEEGVIFPYEDFKRTCDDYFYLPARSEHRGTGGIFFDDMNASKPSINFVKDVVTSWLPSYLPIISKRRSVKYNEQQKQWQLLRRGRYLEFNLLYDRGVKFGLANASPRVEGVMVSAPPLIAWEYKHEIKKGSEEERLTKILKCPKEWATTTTTTPII